MGSGFHHEAVFYGSDQEYVTGLLPDLRAATTVLVAVSEEKGALLRGALGADAGGMRFTDMEALGRNPACIIPAWREFLAVAAPVPVRRAAAEPRRARGRSPDPPAHDPRGVGGLPLTAGLGRRTV